MESGKITYKLKFSVGDITQITFPTRLKVSQALNFNKTDNQQTQALKIIETYSGVPIAILNSVDLFDFTVIGAIISFFV